MKKLMSVVLALIVLAAPALSEGPESVNDYRTKQQSLWDSYQAQTLPWTDYQIGLTTMRDEYLLSQGAIGEYMPQENELWKQYKERKIPLGTYRQEMDLLKDKYGDLSSVIDDYQDSESNLWTAYTNKNVSLEEYTVKLIALRSDLSVALSNSKVDVLLTLAQLQSEYLNILEAMWKSDEWQKVEVPAGVYQIGVEIPAGEWTLSNSRAFLVGVGSTLNDTKTRIHDNYRKAFEYIEKEDYQNGWTILLEEGDFIELSAVVYFSTPIKGQGFNFK